jgi:23S rRNA pseudouridine1911/1915/1917 synthase
VRRLEVGAARAGRRLDTLVVEAHEGLSRAGARRLFDDGRVRVVGADGRRRRASKGEVALGGDVIEIDVADSELVPAAQPDRELELEVVFENDHLVVVNKAAGVPSAPLRPGERGTVANALVARYPEMEGVGYHPREPGLCHRLDNGTSGLLMAARSSEAFDRLRTALRRGSIDKRYLLLCPAPALDDEGVIDVALAQSRGDRRRVQICADAAEARRVGARPALTHYRVVRRAADVAVVEARVPSAFRHQVRAHFAAIGHPLLGDLLYGAEPPDPESGLTRHALHASHLAWSGDAQLPAFEVHSELPDDLARLVAS